MISTFWDRQLRFWFCAFLLTLIAYLCGVRFHLAQPAGVLSPAPTCATEIETIPAVVTGDDRTANTGRSGNERPATPLQLTRSGIVQRQAASSSSRVEYSRSTVAKNNSQPGSNSSLMSATPASFHGGPVSSLTERTSKAGTAAGRVEHLARTERPAAKLRSITCEVTAYTNGPESTGKRPGDKGYGITASGTKAGPGTIAADPHVYPFGTRLMVGSYRGVVRDTGGAIKGRRLDLWMSSVKQARQFGRQTLIVKVNQ